MRFSRLVPLTTLALLAGCSGRIVDVPLQVVQGPICPAYERPTRQYASDSEALPELTYAAIDKMTFCSKDVVSERVPITVSSVTDSRHLDQSSTFGNMVADFARGPVAKVVEIAGGVISGLCNEPDSAVRRRWRLHHGEG